MYKIILQKQHNFLHLVLFLFALLLCSNIQAKTSGGEPCAQIMLFDGSKINAVLVSITATSISYRICNMPDSEVIVTPKTSISSISAPDGSTIFSNKTAPMNSNIGANTPQNTGNRPVNGIAIAGFVLSLLFAPLGLIFSIVGLSQINRNPLVYSSLSTKFAIAGIVIGGLFTLLFFISILPLLLIL